MLQMHRCDHVNVSCCSILLTDHNAIVPGDNFDSFLEDLNDDVSSSPVKLQQLEERTTDTL